jgi:large subunit ribosomal protein L18
MRAKKNFIVQHRRKRDGRTDYQLRLGLLKSGKPRLVVRKSGKNITCQIVVYENEGDKVVVSSDSKELVKLGWKFHGGNLPSAYLTGMLCAKRAAEKGVGEAIFDLGLYMSTPGNRLYSALKGAVEGGLNVPHSKEILPKDDRVSGVHIQMYAAKLKKEDHAKYSKLFSAYLKEHLDPENIAKAFEEMKAKISSMGPTAKKVKAPAKENKPAAPKKMPSPVAKKPEEEESDE